MKISNKDLLEKQEKYLNNKTKKNLIDLYYAIFEMSKDMIYFVLKKYNMYKSKEEVVDIAVDIAVLMSEKYLYEKLKITTSFTGYIYKAIMSQLFPKEKKRYDLEEDIILSDLDIEEEILQDIEEEVIAETIRDVVLEHIEEEDLNTQYNVVYHLKETIGRRKSIDSYLYKISNKKERDLFIDIVYEIKAFLNMEV